MSISNTNKLKLSMITALTAVIDPRHHGQPSFRPVEEQEVLDPNAPSRSSVLGRDRQVKREARKLRNQRKRRRGW